MAVYHEDIIDIELSRGNLFRSFVNHAISEGDEAANRFGVRLFRNGNPVSISGSTVTGYFIRSDGATVILTGTASGNEAIVGLPASCYAVEGNFTLAIKITDGSVTGTMRIVDGTVVNTTTNAIVDPGGIVPDLSELMAVIGRAEAAAAAVAEFSVYAVQVEGNDYAIVVNTD